MIWVVFALLSLAGLAIALYPLRRAQSVPLQRFEAVPAVLVDQIEEIDRDLERGLISGEEAEGARQEIRRRMAQILRRKGEADLTRPGGRLALFVAAVFVPAMAFAYYAVAGSPSVPAVAYADRTDERAAEQQIAALAAQLRDRLNSEPDGGATEGWMLLGQTYSRMGRFDAAAEAFQTAAGRSDASSATWSMLAEAVIRTNGGTVTPRALAALETAEQMDPGNPAATFYLAVADRQAGDAAAAHDRLTARLAQATAYQPWMDAYVAQANAIGAELGRPLVSARAPAAPGPTAADVAAAQDMSDEDRSAFIRSMVDRLAARLKDEPNDVDGWLRLANAYGVLNDPARAVEAYRRVEGLLPEDDPRKADVRARIARLENP